MLQFSRYLIRKFKPIHENKFAVYNVNSILINSQKFIHKEWSQKRCLSLGIIGVPFSAGQPRDGVQYGPEIIRFSGLLKQLRRLGHDVIDLGDVNTYDSNNMNRLEVNSNIYKKPMNAGLKNEILVSEMCSLLIPFVKQVSEQKRIPVVLGGDHTIAMGSICGNASVQSNHDMCVVWVDAHADINTVSTTTTGNIHGMAVSFLVKQIQLNYNDPNNDCMPFKPCINAQNLAFIGLRDLETHEMKIVRDLKITYFSMRDIDKLGINEVMSRTLDLINPNLKRPIHVSFDIDSIDNMLCPSTGTSVPGGLTLREAFCIGEEISKTNLICGLDMVEVNPKIGNQSDVEKTVSSALNVILTFFGKHRTDNYAIPILKNTL